MYLGPFGGFLTVRRIIFYWIIFLVEGPFVYYEFNSEKKKTTENFEVRMLTCVCFFQKMCKAKDQQLLHTVLRKSVIINNTLTVSRCLFFILCCSVYGTDPSGLSTWQKLSSDSNQLTTAADNFSLPTFIFHNNWYHHLAITVNTSNNNTI